MDMENSVSVMVLSKAMISLSRVITRMDRHSLIIAVSNHIRRVHVVEHSLGLLGSKQHSHGTDGWVPILRRVDPGE